MDKWIAVYSNDGVLLHSKRDWAVDICNNMGESRILTLSERGQTPPPKSTYCVIPYIWNSRRYKLISCDRKQKVIAWITKKEEETSLVYTYVQTYQVVHFKYVQFITC